MMCYVLSTFCAAKVIWKRSPKWISLKTRTSRCNMDCENISFRKGWKPKTIKMAAHVLPVSTFIVLLKIITFMQIHSQMLSWLCFIQINLYSAQNEIFLLLFFISFNFQISILFLFKHFHCVVLVKRQFYIVINWKYCGLHYDLKRSLWGTVTQDNWSGHSSSRWGQKVKTDISHMTKRLKEMKVKSLKITIISLISCLLRAWTWGDKR